MVEEPIHPVNIPRREKDFQGMLEYKKEDELKLVKNLILGKNINTQQVKRGFVYRCVIQQQILPTYVHYAAPLSHMDYVQLNPVQFYLENTKALQKSSQGTSHSEVKTSRYVPTRSESQRLHGCGLCVVAEPSRPHWAHDSLCLSRAEASWRSRESDPRSASLHTVHVSETCRLCERRPESPHSAYLNHQQY